MKPETIFDLDKENIQAKVSWSTAEDPAERDARIKRDDREHRHEIHMSWARLGIAVFLVASAIALGAVLATSPDPAVSKLGSHLLAIVLAGSMAHLLAVRKR